MSRRLSVLFATSVLAFGLSSFSGASAAAPPSVDGELYVGGKLPPPPNPTPSSPENPVFETDPLAAGTLADVYQRDLAHWRDPLTAPHTRTSCVSYASGTWPWGGGWKTCNGWKTESQWYYNTATMIVTTPTTQDIQDAVEKCLLTGVVVAALAAYVSDGTVEEGAFEVAMKDCLVDLVILCMLKLIFTVIGGIGNKSRETGLAGVARDRLVPLICATRSVIDIWPPAPTRR
jgi:hypothetical protein